MADAIRPTKSIESFRETQISQAAAHRGDAGRTGAAVTRADETREARHDEGPATVVEYTDLGEGRTQMKLSDGRSVLKSANEMLREDEPDGSMRLSLPNGILVQRDADGKTAGFDPASGKPIDVTVDQQSENGQYYFKFKDTAGNRWMATSDTLRFEVTNASGTVHQKIASTGSVQISTTTVLRDEAGHFRQENATITVRPDGQVIGQGIREKNVHLTHDTLTYNQSNGTRVAADLAYPIPFELQTEAPPAAPTPAPPAAPSTLMQAEPEAPVMSGVPPADVPASMNPTPQAPSPASISPNAYGPGPSFGAGPSPAGAGPFSGGPAAPQFGPSPSAAQLGAGPSASPFTGGPTAASPFVAPQPGMGMPFPGMGMPFPGMGMPFPGMGMPFPGMGMPFPGGMPNIPYPYGVAAPWSMPPFATGPNPAVGLPADPYATVNTAGGMIRGTQPDGSSFVSLPNGIVVAQSGDGSFSAYDARANQPLPAVAQDVVTPNGGAEKQIVFRDATGNEYMMYSKSLDFAVTSADGRMRQIVMPQGNVLVMAQVPGVDPQGKPTVTQHMVEVLPDGRTNTFGSNNVALGLDNLTVGTPNGPVQMPLPYPIPQWQGMLSTIQGVAQYPTAVSGTMYTPSTQPPAPPQAPPQTPPSAPPSSSAGPSPSSAGSPFWGPNGPVFSERPASTEAPPTAPPASSMAPPNEPPELTAAVDQIMQQALGEKASPEATAELRPLLVKVLTNTATPEEAQRANAIVESAMAAPAPEAGKTEAPAPQAGANPEAEIKAQIKTGVAQLLGPSGDPKVGEELEALYFKAVTGAATEADTQRLQQLEQVALAGNPQLKAQLEAQAAAQSQAAAPQTDAPAPQAAAPKTDAPAPQAEAPKTDAPAPQAEAPKTDAPAPQAEAPKTDAPAPQATAPQAEAPAVDMPALDDTQKAAVAQAMTQMQSAGADEATLRELQPLLARIVSQQATPEETQRADAIVQNVLANAPQPQETPPSELHPAPYGIPHVANTDELWAAANGRPEFASASNTPASYQQWAQAVTQAAQAQAQQGGATPVAAPPPADTAAPVSAPGAAPSEPGAVPPTGASAQANAANASAAAGSVPPSGASEQASAGGPSATEGPQASGPAGATGEAGGASAHQGPHKPGIWQRMKSFFTGNNAGQPHYTSWNPHGAWTPYPGQMYNHNPYAPYHAMQAMMAAQMLTTTLSTMMFMPSIYYWNPIGFAGGYGAFPGVLW